MQRTILIAVAAAIALTVHAANPQHEKMKTCNADAAKQELKGDARKGFMKECLSAKKGATKKEADAQKAPNPKEARKVTSQQNKMKTCNVEAKTRDLSGAARRAFMKECLSAN